MTNDLESLQVALQFINPNVPQTDAQRVESYNQRAVYLDEQAKIEQAALTKARAGQPQVFGVNVPK